jgi:type VI secretion system protein VasD
MIKYGSILAVVLIMISACGLFGKDEPPPALEPTRIVLELEAAGDINPNIAGRASPLVLRIYHLMSYSVFRDADFNSLFEKDSEVLGRDLVDKKEIYLKPNEKRTVYFEASDAIRTVGVMAAFRYYHQGQWKAATTVQRNKTNVIYVFIKGTNVQMK